MDFTHGKILVGLSQLEQELTAYLQFFGGQVNLALESVHMLDEA